MVRLFNVNMGKVKSPFSGRLVKRPSYKIDNSQIIENNKLVIDPPRSIKLGIQLDPNTGTEIGDFYLPFDGREHEPAALIWGGSGSGKCLHGDTKIRLKDGSFITLEKLHENFTKLNKPEVLSCNLDKFNTEFKEISNITRRKIESDENILKINTNGNHSLRVTKNHKVFVWNEGFIEKNASELKPGDYLISLNSNMIELNKDLVKDYEIIILAYLIGDGNFQKSGTGFRFTNSDDDMLSDFEKCINDYGFTSYKKVKYADKSSFDIVVNSGMGVGHNRYGIDENKNQIKKFYDIFNVNKNLDSYTKYVPDIVMKTSLRQKGIFLNRLYSCDGFVGIKNIDRRSGTIDYHSNSIELIKGIQQLLLDLGIIGNVCERYSHAVVTGIRGRPIKSYSIHISGVNNFNKFYETIGFIKKMKSDRLHCLLDISNGNSFGELLPNMNKWILDLKLSKKLQKYRRVGTKKDIQLKAENMMRVIKKYTTSKLTPTRFYIKKMLKLIERKYPDIVCTEPYKFLKFISESNLTYYEVNEITETKEHDIFVYDVEVKDNHNLFVGDFAPFLVHNSVALARIESEISFNYSRSILIFDFKNQYRFAYLPNDNLKHVEILRMHGETPRGINSTKCFLPVHVVNKYGDEFCKLTYGYTDTWSLTLNDCDTAGLLMLGQKELEGMAYILFLESAITTIRKRDGIITIDSLIDELSALKEEEGTSKKSVDTIIGMVRALEKMGILSDKGNSILELMHPPRRPGLGGDVFIFNLAGAGPDDIQTRGILINLLNAICHTLKNKINVQPVIAIEEASSFFSKESSQNMRTALNQLHYVMGRSLGIFRLYIYQRKNQIPLDLFDDKGVSILIETMNNFQLGNGQQLSGAGIAKVTIRDVTFMPNDVFLVKILPPRCKVS